MTNKELAQKFADIELPVSVNANGNIVAEANSLSIKQYGNNVLALYSYSTPIALRIGGQVIKDARKYSVTTSKHSGLIIGDYVDHGSFRAKCNQLGVDISYAR